MSKLEQLTSFIQVVEQQGIHPAAHRLHLSAPAISKQIQTLETSLGVALFDRTRRRLKLTDMGLRYYQEAVAALKNLQQLEALIHNNHKQVAGILRVRTTQYYADTIIFKRLGAFLKRYPQLQLKLEIHEFLPDFEKEAVDIVMGASIPGKPNWVQKRIGTTRYVLCATPHYFKLHGIPKKPADLLQHRYLTHMGRPQDCLIRFRDQQQVVSPYLWFSNYAGLISAALESLGIIWAHEGPIQSHLKSGALQEVMSTLSLRDQAVYLYYPQSPYPDVKVQAFVRFFETPVSQ